MGFSHLGHALLVPHAGGAAAAQSYADKVKSVFGDSLIAYWPLWETEGDVADNYEGTAARDGSYTGVTLGQTGIGDGRAAPFFDGVNDHVNIFTTSLADVFSANAGTVMAWARVANAGVWSDSGYRVILVLQVGTLPSSQNRILLRRNGIINNRLELEYRAGNVSEIVALSNMTTTDWFHLALTWDKNAGSDGQVIGYLDGQQVDTTKTSLGTWAGALGLSLIGAFTLANDQFWSGNIAHVAVSNTALTPAQIAELATV